MEDFHEFMEVNIIYILLTFFLWNIAEFCWFCYKSVSREFSSLSFMHYFGTYVKRLSFPQFCNAFNDAFIFFTVQLFEIFYWEKSKKCNLDWSKTGIGCSRINVSENGLDRHIQFIATLPLMYGNTEFGNTRGQYRHNLSGVPLSSQKPREG